MARDMDPRLAFTTLGSPCGTPSPDTPAALVTPGLTQRPIRFAFL
jgi:hypothetical protein